MPGLAIPGNLPAVAAISEKNPLLPSPTASGPQTQEVTHLESIYARPRREACPGAHVLYAMRGHLLAAIVLNATVLKQVSQIIREFLWHGRKAAAAGHYAMNWRWVCMPFELGGLSIRNLHRIRIALHTRWCGCRLLTNPSLGAIFPSPTIPRSMPSSVLPPSGTLGMVILVSSGLITRSRASPWRSSRQRSSLWCRADVAYGARSLRGSMAEPGCKTSIAPSALLLRSNISRCGDVCFSPTSMIAQT